VTEQTVIELISFIIGHTKW